MAIKLVNIILISVYRFTIDLTLTTVNSRARLFRDLVMVVVAIGLCSVVVIITIRMLWPLISFVALAPVCGLFFWLDAKRLSDWRMAVLAKWSRKEIDLYAFFKAMWAIPNLPEATLHGMLNLLGTWHVGPMEAKASIHTRQTVAAIVGFTEELGLRQLAVKVCASTIVAVSVMWATIAYSWQPLGLLAMILLLPSIFRRIKWSLRHQSRAVVIAAKQHSDFDADIFRSLIEQLPLGGGLLLADIWVESESAKL
jgi:hypothetical protein